MNAWMRRASPKEGRRETSHPGLAIRRPAGDFSSVAGFEIAGLGNWKRRAGLWAAIGLIGLAISKPDLPWALLALVLGGSAGALSILLVSRRRERLANLPTYLGIATLVGLALVRGEGLSGIACFSLGSLFVAADAVTSGLLGERLVQGLNTRHREVLDLMEKIERNKAHRPLQPAAPTPVPADTLRAFLDALPEPLASEARGFARPIIIATPFRSLETLPPAHSSLSGPALLAPGESWPERHGRPLEFLARIDLSQVPASGVTRPAGGLVEFFYDSENQPWGFEEADLGGARILHHLDPSNLQPTLKPGSGPHPPLRKPLQFASCEAFSPSSDFEDRFLDFLQQSDEATHEKLDDLHETLLENAPPETHRVLSLPLLIQGDMDGELKLASRLHGLPESTEWTLLLQLDSDDELGWCWGDAGFLYFWVPTADLAAGRFDRCWVVLQCT